ncbi:hypothetical protein [Burkholderia mayonis]|uniref:Uncharacterized protein n=1 Tax=Burkholderia mayonis TaxID=1385591 RepID=A0A1B4FT88_9BURK|nr:hypothetical protein [Burkholderia mayonis]AOJ06893.1 hypothetical protein WS71_05865 [Burkholderia mayonis]KVE59030.1 hypothetical protein WS71_01235 [Burkholderia mayonis]
MTSFVELQDRFVAAEFAALGLAQAGGQVLQPASLLRPGDNESLWSFFNTIPADLPIYAPSDGDTFFAAYSALISSLEAGSNPLDPISVAKRRLAEWGQQPPAWNVDYMGFMTQLAKAPSGDFQFSSEAEPNAGFWGIWGGSAPTSGPSAQFAAGNVSGQFEFKHVLSFSPTPSNWYVSSALSLAHATTSGPPWNPGSPINWQSTFGPQGNMQRFVASLLVVSGMNVQYTSSASLSKADQQLIQANQAEGMWPYYLNGAATSTRIRFNNAGQMTVEITSEQDAPIVLAASVLTAAQFLGG